MESRRGLGNVVASALRSVNIASGALIGAAAPVAYLFAGIVTESMIGRPSPDQMAGTLLFGLPLLGGLGALAGAMLGWVAGLLMRRTRLAGESGRSVVVAALALVLVIGGVSGVQVARQSEARNRPRVVHTTGAVARFPGFGTLAPATPATLMLSALPSGEVAPLAWRGGRVGVRLDGTTLVVSHGSAIVSEVSLSGLDYVREVLGVTATEGQSLEWLALLVRLRATGRRELLLIYDSTGVLVHEELLARTKSGPQQVLWNVSPEGGEQAFLVDLGEPLRYVLKK